MKNAIAMFLEVVKMLRALFATKLPETPAEHESWASEIIKLGKFPDNDSFRHALATQILHLPPNILKQSKMWFVKNLKRSIANQTAFQVIQQTKGKDGSQEKSTEAGQPGF